MIGKILGGRYQITTRLGQGNFSTTFLAVDMQLPNNPQCVVKHLLPQTTDPLILEMARILFDNEAKVLNRLGTHDQIPRLLAHFEEDQEFYLVQEFIEGHDLSREITPGKQLSEAETVDLLQDILKVLVFVHQHKVIHRDIKPSNLIRRWRDGRIFLIDFGAVKEISSQVVNVEGQTESIPVGTPGYMPTEQTQNKPRLCSDIYAVGIIGLKALTGLPALQLPEDANTGEIIWRDRVQVSSELADVLDNMVRYHFSQRYQSADEVLQALQNLTTPISLNEPTVLLQPKRRAILWQALIGLGITAVITTIILWPRDNLLTYDNSTYGVGVKYPQSWTRIDTLDPITGSLATFMSPVQANNSDIFQENIRLIVQNLAGKNVTLEEYTKTSINEIKLFSPDAEIIEQRNTQLANEPAHQVVYSGKEEGYTLKHLQIWTIKDNKVYIITYTAEINKYSEYLRTVQKMINSFEIKSTVDDQSLGVSRFPSKLRHVGEQSYPLG